MTTNNLQPDSQFPNITSDQYVAILTDRATGKVLKENLEFETSDSIEFRIFDSLDDAREYARKMVGQSLVVECLIVDSEIQVVEKVVN